MKNYKLTAKTFAGLENVLAKEIEKLGGSNIQTGLRAVHFDGDLKLIYRSNYLLRSALRVLVEISNFQFRDVDQFYLKCKQIKWENFFSAEQSFIINSTITNSREFNNSMFASLKAKDAIADYFRQKSGKRPNVDTQNPDIYIDIHINQNNCIISLDSSGESLHKRGYRVIQGEAPLNEVLAAGMILLTGWDGSSDFVDPMCGSGTLPIEAAFIAQNIPAGKFRKNFAFENWNNFNSELLGEIKESVIKKEITCKIYASDISSANILNAQTNARRALVFKYINFKACDIRNLDIDVQNSTIIINPPYGERLKENNLEMLYKTIGERLKHKFSNNNIAWILSASIENFKHIGLKPDKKIDLFNGSLMCKYNMYRLFSGKLSQQKNKKN